VSSEQTPAQQFAERAEDVARTLITEARIVEGADEFDFYTAANGIEPFGPLYNQLYILVRGLLEREDPSVSLEEVRARTVEAWPVVLPTLEEYREDCRTAKFTGWSRMSGGPLKRDSPSRF
jgi:hypothetical protein